MSGIRFVVFGDDWGRHVSTMQHVFRRLLPEHEVVWINGIGHRRPRLTLYDMKRAVSKLASMARPSNDARPSQVGGLRPSVVIAPRVVPWHDVELVHRLNTRSLLSQIRPAVAAMRGDGPLVLVTGSPPSAGVVGALGEDLSLYYCMDDFLHLPGTSPDLIGPMEQRLLDRVDMVVATARALEARKTPASGVFHYLPQGVNYEHFAAGRPVPAELAGLPRPIVGFAGGVGPACDEATLLAVARRFAGGSLVLVGPVSMDTRRLEAEANVHLLGARPYAELPAYVQAFDVGIIPYAVDDWTSTVDPLKLLEYLAAGTPVVTTPLPEVAKYDDVVRVAAPGAAFADAVAAELDAPSAPLEARRATARANDWDHRAARFMDLVRSGLATGSAPLGRTPAGAVAG